METPSASLPASIAVLEWTVLIRGTDLSRIRRGKPDAAYIPLVLDFARVVLYATSRHKTLPT